MIRSIGTMTSQNCSSVWQGGWQLYPLCYPQLMKIGMMCWYSNPQQVELSHLKRHIMPSPHLLNNNNQKKKELSQAIWKKWYVQPRLRLFLWKCSKNVLPLSEILFKRSSKGDPCCALCGQEESMQHMLFNCPFARACWFIGSVVLRSDAIQGTISQILRHLAQTLDEVEWTTCVNMMWAIWRCRNDKSYSSKTPTAVMFRQHLSTSVGNVTGKLC